MSSFEIRGPEDLRKLGLSDLEHLAQDLRQTILSVALRNGGHLGASLGAVELAIALHRNFNSPSEPILWDVGHQAYPHKLLTGRWAEFQNMRTLGGLSGFPSRNESPHDVFGTGHSSTSLSAALAMAWARRSSGDWTIAVVGDGGLSAGIAFEALNNLRSLELGPLLVVLNDNHMSISKSVGAVTDVLGGAKARDFFEAFGFEYEGPVDGNNLTTLLGAIDAIKYARPKSPVLLHVLTEKGRGYAPAEELPGAFHGVSPVIAKKAGKTGKTEKLAGFSETKTRLRSFSEAFGTQLCESAALDSKVVAITAAMTEGTGLTEFARRFPERIFDVGIAEQHAVTFAAGLATQGFKPVVAIYSTFLQRAFDSIIHDVALQNLGVVFALDRAGLVGPDGPTHHGVFDLAYLGMIPGMRVFAPACIGDLSELLERSLSVGGPVAIRFPRGGSNAEYEPLNGLTFRELRAPVSPRLILVALGAAISEAARAVMQIDPDGQKIALLNVVQAKPLEQDIENYLLRFPGIPVLSVEAGAVQGGFGHALAAAAGAGRNWHFAGIPDRFIPHGSVAELELNSGLSADAIAERIREVL